MLLRLRHGYRQWLVSGGYLLLVFVGAQIDEPLGWQACAAGIAALALIAWLMTLRRARAIADTPTSAIASAAQGYVELLGRGVALGGTPLLAPLRPLPCLWYRYRVERRQDDKWVTESSGESTDSFLLDDGSGECLVDPEGAEILPRDTQTWTAGDTRYTLATLVAGEPIYVLGAFRTLGGTLSATHTIGRPTTGQLFLISSLAPEKLQRHYLRWAIAHVSIFLAALAWFAWLRQL